jgi:hypothetical protein
MGLRFITRDWQSKRITGVIPFSKFSFTDTLCAAGTWSGELDPYDPAAALLVPHRTYVYALKDEDNSIEFAGMLGALDWNAGGNEGVDTLAASGYSLWGYFWRRLIDRTYNFNNVEQFTIAATMLADAQNPANVNNGSIDVTVAQHPAGGSGQPRIRAYDYRDGKNLAEAIEQLADCLNGFEHRIVAAWSYPPGASPTITHTFEMWAPRIGVDQPYVWRDGTAVRVKDFSVDSNSYASQALVTGTVVGNGNYGPSVIVTTNPRGEPLYEIADNETDVSDTATLTDKGNQALQTSEQYLVQVDLLDEQTWPYGTWAVGDTVRIVADRGSLQLHGDIYWRIVGRTVEVDDIGAVTTSINFTDSLRRSKPVTRAARTLARQQAAQKSAVSTLQRHP